MKPANVRVRNSTNFTKYGPVSVCYSNIISTKASTKALKLSPVLPFGYTELTTLTTL